MYSRITTGSMNETMLNSVNRNRAALSDTQRQLATGKKIYTPSQDVKGSIEIMSANQSLDKIDIYINNIDRSLGELNTADGILTNITDYLHRVRELTTQAANGVYTEDELTKIADEIKEITEALKDFANTKYGSHYLFSGTEVNTPAYSSPAEGEYMYEGTPINQDYQRVIEISEGITAEVNEAGENIFGYYYEDPSSPGTMLGDGLFNTLGTLISNLEASPPDYNAIKQGIDNIDNDLTTVLKARTKFGTEVARMEMTRNKLEEDEINFTEIKAKNEEVDITEAVTNMQMQELALQASMQVSAQLMGISLLNYM